MRRTRNVLISFLTGATLLVGAGAVAAPAATAAAQAPIRINAGGGAGTFEGVAWEADRYYTGGTTSWSADAVSGTGASALYQARRVAPKGYDIPVAAGTYDVTLHTAETWFTADGKRVFSATAEGATVFSDLDLHKVAGHDKAYTATTRVSVTDGNLDLDLSARTNNAVLAGISVVPVPAQAPIRINAGGGAGTFEGVAWEADRYYTGGTTSWSADAVSGTGASALYQARRVAPKGYDIPVAAGTYDVTLHTAETWFTADGKRVFSATAEGATVFSDLDLHKVAGHDKAYTATTRVSVTDGILDLDLSARTNNAVLAGITVTPLVPTSQPAPTTAAPAPAPTTAAPAPAPTTVAPAPAPTTVAPAPAPTTAAPAPSTSSWKAPTLVNPIVWTPSASNRIIKAPADRDVLVRWPSTPVEAVGGFEINGGRNVVSIGGTITFTKRHFPAGVDDANKNRALYITGNSSVQKPRTVHVEGLHIAGTYTWEGINIDSKKERGTLTVQLRDITVDQVNVDLPGGTGKHYGGDALQPWNGPHVLRVDGFDARGLKYQGLFLQGTAFGTGDLGRWDIRNVYLEGHKDGHGYLLWRAMPDVIDYENIRVRPRPGTSGDRTVQRMSTDWPGVTILS